MITQTRILPPTASFPKPVLQGSVRFRGSESTSPASEAGDRFEKRAESGETREKSTGQEAGQKIADFIKSKGFLDRKVAAAQFLKAATGIDHTEYFSQPTEPVSKEATSLAETVKQLQPQEKVDMVKAMTGDASIYAKYVEKVLIHQQKPSLSETFQLFKPQIQEKNFSGVTAAFGAMGTGLMLMPIVLPSSVLFNPNLAGQLVAGLGLLLV